ncbi:glycosyltransferase family 4 protein [Desulfococcus multivorans]|uniref:Glycosyl transferase group 1 n=1 Tax=Desulfococcus multivorans DSM 2059 TaxID=1121405 RepID=S7U453_DESML|nr:glycosyltransferase family 4 protein [Desulfococcus multivorans]AOY59001.1 glycosyl transferase, family 1 [Desulfococcus multivorans]AQV01264.1 glycosyl transferase family 1 [Desulfococcus multivorans]EPR43750.1 glycosyl transferase group 1 [Desulfococcus multivorans DSM 2059]SJZ55148.1 Glycosyltransferase involved in cell wall bisynthesis [Desulfococcus multivorans DSM 2059]
MTTVNTIAMLGSFPPLRGVSGYCLELAAAMAERGRVDFISFREMYPRALYPGGDLADDTTFPEVFHPRLTVRRRLTWYDPAGWIKAGLGTRAELLHAQWWSLPLAPVYMTICAGFKARKKPVVFTVHNVLPHETAPAYIAASRALFTLGDRFIVHTEKNRRQLAAHYGIPESRISRIPHGTLDFQARSGKSDGTFRTDMGIGPEEKIVLLFGAVRPYKGVDTALKALAEILKIRADVRLVIAGKLWESWAPYECLIRKLGLYDHVLPILDYIPSAGVHRLFTAADLVILPYHHFDSQSGVAGTALAFRKPMIVSAVGGLPDLVKNPACVVPPQNPAALARAVVRCLQDPNRLRSLAADAHALSRDFSWKAIAKATFLVYKDACKKL